ncbi:MAG TPA: HisA/HisF-related TIM barrel protein [Actinomycetota bacterium]|nr:HisA/HisF-related TIM barrel protein [Actinomycetota bacterium]
MGLEVIPGLDVSGGRLVRITPQGPEPLDAFGGDPVAAASAFAQAGARHLHVVDVDLASSGRVENANAIASVSSVGVPVQASGGVRNADQADALLAAGASRVVLGSAGLADRRSAEALVERLGDALVVGIEGDGPVIRPRGTADELPMWDTVVWLATVPVRRFLFTEVGRVGGLAGPDLDGMWAFASHSAAPVLVAGGIRGVEDLRSIAALPCSIEGAIVGRALYEGTDLGETISAVA